MNADSSNLRDSRARWKRRIGVVTVAIVVLAGTVLACRHALLTWGINRVLTSQGVAASVESVRWDLRHRTLTLVQILWDDPTGSGLTLGMDTLTIEDLRWRGDSLHATQLRVLNLSAEGTGLGTSDRSTPRPSWKELWPGALSSVSVDVVHWNAAEARPDSATHVRFQEGYVSGLRLNARGVTVPRMVLSGAEMTSAGFADAVVLNASEASASWSENAWSLHSPGLHLPGLEFQGDFAWPERKGHGSVDVQWSLLQPWAGAFGTSEVLKDWGLDRAQTTATWDLDSTNWHLLVVGPAWLKASILGETDEWRLNVDLASTPPALGSVLSVSSMSLQARGDRQALAWKLKGDSLLDVEGQASVDESWMQTLDPSSHRWTAHVDIHRWPEWIANASLRTEADIQATPGQIFVHARQDSASIPWSAEATWTADRITLRGTVPSFPVASGGSLPVHVWGHAETSESLDKASWKLHASIKEDTLTFRGSVNTSTQPLSWMASLDGAGLHAEGRGNDSPARWVEAVHRATNRRNTVWPSLEAECTLSPENALTECFLPNLVLQDKAFVEVHSQARGVQAQARLSRWTMGGWEFDSTHVTLQGAPRTVYVNVVAETPDSRAPGIPWMLSLDIHADTSWMANLAVDMGGGQIAEWAVEGTPPQSNQAPWSWTAYQGEIPLGFDRLVLAETPFSWTAPLHAPLPSFWRLQGRRGSLVFQSRTLPKNRHSVGCYGNWDHAENWVQDLIPGLGARRLALQGNAIWDADASSLSAQLDVQVDDFQFEHVAFPSLSSSLRWQRGSLFTSLDAIDPSLGCEVHAQGVVDPRAQTTPGIQLKAERIPVSWFQAWVDSGAAHVNGEIDAAVTLSGPLASPSAEGSGSVRWVEAFVPSLGTSFGGKGSFDIQPDGLVLSGFSLSDALGVTTRVEGALLHDQFTDWNLDVALVDAKENVLIMDLPAAPDAPVYGSLHGRGSVNVFFWNNQITVEGDVVADAPTDFHISLITESDDGWEELVHFTQPEVSEASEEKNARSSNDLSVTLDLNIEALPTAKVNVVMDEENEGNIVGYTQGNIHFVLEDWERMTLNGELEVVSGQYDFALGPFLSKSFVAREGGTLFWGGDPYEGTLNLDAVYTTRANVSPLLGSSSNGGTQTETIDVILHLRGPMLKPNISFDLEAPKADRLVAEALSSALADETDRTNQAIALMSLQEFLPNSFNTLELGTNGLQEYSIDMVTSQLSRWLSRINDDVEVGISYDATNSFNPSLTDNQDALQLALKASFLEDKLEVEGSLGSSAITQEALGEARLQNIRVKYHLNEEKGLDLTGFSESQSSATQLANSTSQGVGIRWHRSFNWTWPWRQTEAED